jgi:catechol-2,3-dioxygenase
MTVEAFGHVNLRAPRELLEQLREFYSQAVGLRVGERPAFASFGYWLYAGAHDVLHLTQTGPAEVRRTDTATTFDHLALRCQGRAAVEQRLQRLGVAFRTAQVPGTGQVQLFLRDPAGNGVELNFAGPDA